MMVGRLEPAVASGAGYSNRAAAGGRETLGRQGIGQQRVGRVRGRRAAADPILQLRHFQAQLGGDGQRGTMVILGGAIQRAARKERVGHWAPPSAARPVSPLRPPGKAAEQSLALGFPVLPGHARRGKRELALQKHHRGLIRVLQQPPGAEFVPQHQAQLEDPPALADGVEEDFVEDRNRRAVRNGSSGAAHGPKRVDHAGDVHLLGTSRGAGLAGRTLPDETAGEHRLALVQLHHARQFVRFEVASGRHRAAAGALRALVAAHG